MTERAPWPWEPDFDDSIVAFWQDLMAAWLPPLKCIGCSAATGEAHLDECPTVAALAAIDKAESRRERSIEMSEHIPETWELDFDDWPETAELRDRGSLLATIYGPGSFPCLDHEEVAKADPEFRSIANIIRAAPDLLAACLGWVDGWIVARGECPGCRADVDGGEKHLDGCPMQATQAAIDKAESRRAKRELGR